MSGTTHQDDNFDHIPGIKTLMTDEGLNAPVEAEAVKPVYKKVRGSRIPVTKAMVSCGRDVLVLEPLLGKSSRSSGMKQSNTTWLISLSIDRTADPTPVGIPAKLDVRAWSGINQRM